MRFTFKKNNKQTKKPVNCFLQDDASAGMQSLQTSIEIKLCQNPGDRLYTFHKSIRYNFPRNRVIVTGIDDQWQADLVDISSLARFNKGYKFLLTCINVFSKFAWVVPLKNKSGETLVNGFESILDLGRSLEKKLNFSIVIFKVF